MAENWIFIYTIKPNLKVSSIVCRVVSAIALEDVSEELSRLYQAVDMLVKGGSQACEEAFEVTIRGNKMTVASMPIEERTFYFIVSEGERIISPSDPQFFQKWRSDCPCRHTLESVRRL